MSYKIFKKKEYFYIVDNETSIIYEGRERNVIVRKETESSTDFRFKNVENFSQSRVIPISEIQDENGDQYTLAEFTSFYLSTTAVDVVLQDSTSPILIVPFSRLVEETTLTAQPSLDDLIVNVVSATGFVIGQLLTVYDIASNRVYFSKILEINALAITLDTPLDFEFPIGSYVSVGDTNMSVDGSVTPVIFGVRNPTTEDIPMSFDVVRIIFAMLTDTSVDLSKFGDIVGGLTKGIVLRKVDGVQRNVFNAKTNAGLKSLMFDVEIQAASGNAQDGITGRLTFGGQNKLGAVIRLKSNEDLQLVIQDDLTDLSSFAIIAEGSEVVD